MTMPSPLQFFMRVLKPGPELLIGFGVLTAVAAWLALTNAAEAEQMVAYTLLFQMFAAATGYRERARRGHFDPVSVAGWRRSRLAIAHALLSFSPGLIAWLLITAFILSSRPHFVPRSATFPAVAAFIYVSAFAWSFALPLTRYATGVVWLLALVVLAGGGYMEPLRQAYIGATGTPRLEMTRLGAALVCPIFLIASPESADVGISTSVLAAAGICVLAGVRFITRLELPLRNPS
jgi:hypothetical protein